MNPRIVSHTDWVSARVKLLRREKELTRERDALYNDLRSLPWEKVSADYEFDGEDGRVQLSDLFGEHSQLIVYHFMFGEDWDDGCATCSQITDILDRAAVHVGARDVSLVLVSAAPLKKLLAFRQRLGWALPWYSAHDSQFGADFQASVYDVDRRELLLQLRDDVQVPGWGAARHQRLREEPRRNDLPLLLGIRPGP